MWSSRITTPLVYVLVTLFGTSAWLNLQGLFLEFPLIVPQTIEGWRLPATMGLIANSGSVALILVAIIRWCSKDKIVYEIPVNIGVLSIGTGALFALAFAWNKTSIVGGARHSTYLMALSFCLALVDVISSATFMPFLNRYEPRFLNGYLFGEALSSLLPGLLGLAQGVGQETCQNGTTIHHAPRFSVQVYLISLSAIMVCSFIAFIVLCSTNIGRQKTNDTRKRFEMKLVFFLIGEY
jgi:riboflavin transporter 2